MPKTTERVVVSSGTFPVHTTHGEITYNYRIDWYLDEEYQRTTHFMGDEYVETLLRMTKSEWSHEGVKGYITFAEKGSKLEEKVREYEP